MIQIAQVGLSVIKVVHASQLLESHRESPFPSTNLSSRMLESKFLSSTQLAKLSGCSKWSPVTTSPSGRIHYSDSRMILKLVELAESGETAGKGIIAIHEEEMRRVKAGKTQSLE